MIKSNSNKSELVKKHFALTAKEMILKKGVEEISIRKIAHEAGYSPGSIYNHFSSLDEILWYARSIMIEEMGLMLMKKSPNEISNVNSLKSSFRNYMAYFIDNPNIYRFFYFHNLNKKEKRVDSLADSPEFSKQMEDSFAFLLQDGKYTPIEIMTIFKTIIFAIQGILTMVTTENDNINTETAYENLDEIINLLMQKHQRSL